MTTTATIRQPDQSAPTQPLPPARKVCAVVIGLWRFVRRERPKTTRTPEEFGFIVDTSKPPIFPPLREVNESIFPFIGVFETETDSSKARTAAWHTYIEKYGAALSSPKRQR